MTGRHTRASRQGWLRPLVDPLRDMLPSQRLPRSGRNILRNRIVQFGWRYWLSGLVVWLAVRAPFIFALISDPSHAHRGDCDDYLRLCPDGDGAGLGDWLHLVLVPVFAIPLSMIGAGLARVTLSDQESFSPSKLLLFWVSAGLSALAPFIVLLAFSPDRNHWQQVGCWALIAVGVGLASGGVYAGLGLIGAFLARRRPA